jgi:hypothetical protein
VLGDQETRTLMINIVQEVCHLGMLCEPLTEILRRRLPHPAPAGHYQMDTECV